MADFTTPPLFEAPYLPNPCEYLHTVFDLLTLTLKCHPPLFEAPAREDPIRISL